MITFRQISIENRPYCFLDDMINTKNFDQNLLKIDKKSYKNIDIYHIGYDHENFDSENLLYIVFNNVDGYIVEGNSIECNFIKVNSIEESNVYKYLILTSTSKY